MALGSKNSKQPTRKQILEAAAEQDGRRQEQIDNQVKIINRMRDELLALDNFVTLLRDDEANPTWLREASAKTLALVDDIRAQHRKQSKENKDNG